MKPLTSDSAFIRQVNEKAKKKASKVHSSKHLHSETGRKGQPSIELFQKENCPFSHSVRQKLSELGIDYVAHNVTEGNALKQEQLVRAGGKYQIPFLIDHRSGVKLYDSTAIVTYLDREYANDNPKQWLLKQARDVNQRLQARSEQVRWIVQRPIEQLRRLRNETRDTWASFGSSLEMFRGIFQESIRDLKKKDQKTPAEKSATPESVSGQAA